MFHFHTPAYKRALLSQGKTPIFLIDDCNLMGEPATETVPIDSAKAASGLDLRL